jgi:hypothetical protein
MFRAIPCSSSGGPIVLMQYLVSSLSVSSYSVHRLRASDVLAPVLSTLFSLGHNPERNESIYTISKISLRYLLILFSTYADAY